MRDGIDSTDYRTAIAYAQSHPSVAVVGGYGDGRFRWPQSAIDQVRAMGRTYLNISSTGSIVADMLDCEPGNPNAVDSVDWVLMCRAAGVDPGVYCVQWAPGYIWADVIAAFKARGVAMPHVIPAPWPAGVIPPGADGTQYGYPFQNGGPNVDLDLFSDSWPGGGSTTKVQSYVVEV